MIPFLDLKKQYASIQGEIDAALKDVVRSTRFIGGDVCQAFEDAFAARIGVGHCVGVGNGTDAIEISLRALGIGPGDEVIVPAFTFIGTSEPVSTAGATVCFADVSLETRNLDVNAVEAAITPRTKAIILVHLYGAPGPAAALRALADRHGLYLVEDCAQAHGAETEEGATVGAVGHMATFSFYPGKNLGAYGDAGAIVTDDADLARKARMIANHGRITKYDHEFEGRNSRLDAIQAAVLKTKLAHLDRWNARRREIADIYRARIGPDSALALPLDQAGHVYHLFVVRHTDRDALQAFLMTQGVETLIHYPIALPALAAYRNRKQKPTDFPNAMRLAGTVLSLPIYPEMSNADVENVVRAVKSDNRSSARPLEG